MMNDHTNDLLRLVAGKHGVDNETVKSGIREAMLAAKESDSEVAKAFWNSLPDDATELDVVLQITKLLCVS